MMTCDPGQEIGLGPEVAESTQVVLQELSTQIEAAWMALLDANYVPGPPIAFTHAGQPYRLATEDGLLRVSINPGWFTDDC